MSRLAAFFVISLGWLLLPHSTHGQFAQQGSKLVGTGIAGDASQGIRVSLSSDGNTALVGGYGDSNGTGAVWVFTRSGGVWSQQGNKLVGTDAVGRALQGNSVSLSSDGSTALVGGYHDSNGTGAVWVFTRSGGVWSQQGNKLVGTGAVGRAVQGCSVSLSSDGNTALVGGWGDNGYTGAVWIFTRSGGVWSQQGSKLVGTGAAGAAHQGWSVSLSSDGNTALVGGDSDNDGTGAVWIFTRSGGVWSQQGNKLVGTDAVGRALQGNSVSLSSDGNTALVGGYRDGGAGAVWIFTRSGGVWSQQGNKLVGTGAVGSYIYQGWSVSLSSDGNTALVGGWGDNGDTGAVWIFTRSGGVWSQQGNKLVGTGAVGSARQGSSISLSSDGNTALVGGPFDSNSAGAAWVFTRSGGLWSQQGSKLVGTGAGVLGAGQGWSVSLSSDGNTALVGGLRDRGDAGAVWIFTRSGDVWSQQGSKLVGTGAARAAFQGCSVSLSSDGNTALVGGYRDGGDTGAVWIFTRSGGVWSQQGNKLVGTGAVGRARQGFSVSLSSDGNTALVGGCRDNDEAGAAWVFVRGGSGFTEQSGEMPQQYCLSQNYPNPFNPSTTISYSLPHSAFVKLTISNVLGQEVATLVNGIETPGYKSVEFNASNLASSVYLYRLQAGEFIAAKKLILLR